MNNVILASDLDRTLIYSRHFLKDRVEGHFCVEVIKEEDFSFITQEAKEKLDNILNSKFAKNFIPCTTRSINQFKRINIFNQFPYAVTTNGGTILVNGEPSSEWNLEIQKNKKKLSVSYENMRKLILSLYNNYFTQEFKLVDEIFYYTKVHSRPTESQEIKEMLEDLTKTLKNTGWTYTLQGLKLYIIPEYVTKENALDYLINKFFNLKTFVITSGDGNLDIGLIHYGDLSYIPENSHAHKELVEKNQFFENSFVIPVGYDKGYRKYNLVPEDISSSETILNEFIYLSSFDRKEGN